jgi:hypothetical protein
MLIENSNFVPPPQNYIIPQVANLVDLNNNEVSILRNLIIL